MTPPFEPVPLDETPQARCGGTCFGVRLPRSVPYFDCRWHQDRPEPRNPHTGLILWGTERAAYALGDRSAGLFCRYVHPLGTLTPYDTAEPRNAGRVAADIRRLRGMLAQQWREYRRARRNPAAPGEGGGVAFRPVAIALTNFGADVLADTRQSLTYRLDGLKGRQRTRRRRKQ